MTNNVKPVRNLRNLEMLKRKFSNRRLLMKMLIVKDKSVKAKRTESKTSKHSKKLTKKTLMN